MFRAYRNRLLSSASYGAMSLPRWRRKLMRVHPRHVYPSDVYAADGNRAASTFPDRSILVERWDLQPVFVP